MKTKASNKLKLLKRFRQLPQRIKIHLVKAFISPILHYPPIPLVTASNTKIKSLQVIQNHALRFAYGTTRLDHVNVNVKSLHEKAELDPLNYSIHTRAESIYRKLQAIDDPHMTYILDNYEPNKDRK